ncbi:MAG TPA: PAS domain S-box protein [Methanoregula sp.]|nr:PAS domain S-box protein [Methanoregula sp.]
MVGFRGVVADISARKQAESALRESEEKYRTLVEVMQDIVYSLDARGTILYISPQVMDQLGYTPEGVMGRNVTEFVHPDDAGIISSHFRLSSPAGYPLPHDRFRLMMKDGTYRWYEDKSIRILNGNQEQVTIGTIRDITEQKRAHEAILESEARFRDLTDRLPQMVFETDRELRITYANRLAAQVSGFTVDDLSAHKPVLSLIDPGQHGQFMEGVKNILAGFPHEPKEYTAIRKDGSTFPVVVYSSLIYRNLEIVGFRGVAIDISGLRKMEEGICESEEKFRSLVENASDIVFSLDPAGNFTYISPQWSELLGHDTRTLIGTPAAALIHPDDLPENVRAFHAAMDKGSRICGIEYRIRHRNGTWRWHSQSAAPVRNASGEIVSYMGICRDITDQRMGEEALRQVNHKLNILSGITRHDINNQLQALSGYVELLHHRVQGTGLSEDFSRIRRTIEQISNLIQFTKEYEMIGVHEPVWQNLHGIVAAAEKAALPETIRVENMLPRNLDIFADPLISKVFFNLMDNARRHGGSIQQVRFSLENKDGARIVVCSDEGVGVPPADKERIFAPGVGKNTGFGLAISREILDITGITIHETGEAGNGARFEITVPPGKHRTGVSP